MPQKNTTNPNTMQHDPGDIDPNWPCCPCCDEREELLDACRSALAVIKDSRRHIDTVVTAQLRKAILGKYSRPKAQS